mgnify:CR=1 FL=1
MKSEGEYSEMRPGVDLPIGAHHYRAFVGSPDKYDLLSALQFNVLTFLGLREYHTLLDIGCGSLRAGKLLIAYLLPHRYFGIEPEHWLIEKGIEQECGKDLISIKSPTFSNDTNFTCTTFGQKFDFLLAQSIFSHATEMQIRQCLSQASACMHPQSLFVATFVEGPENYRGTEWVYPGVVTYTQTHLQDLAAEHGLALKLLHWPHPNNQTWAVIAFPETLEGVSGPSDVVAMERLKNQLAQCETKLARLEEHPYVKLGLRLRKLLTAAKRR